MTTLFKVLKYILKMRGDVTSSQWRTEVNCSVHVVQHLQKLCIQA